MRHKPTILALSAFILLFSCSSNKQSAEMNSKHGNRKPAADFSLKDENGATVRLADYKGKVVLLNFWATWCGPCGVEIPWFVEFEQTYKSKGFAVLGVSMDEDGWSAVNRSSPSAKSIIASFSATTQSPNSTAASIPSPPVS